MSAEYVLYCIAQSGDAYKPALMLNLCGADWAPRKVEYFQREVDGWVGASLRADAGASPGVTDP